MSLSNGLYNIDSLLLLERLPSRSIDLVYLDPPWPDQDDNIDEYLYFLAQRLQHVHRVLTGTGNLFIHLPPSIVSRVCFLIEQFFRGSSFRNQFILPLTSQRRLNALQPRPDYTVIVLYGKSKQSIYRHPNRHYTDKEIKNTFPYKDTRGRYRLTSLFRPKYQPGLDFEWNGVLPPPGRSWKFIRERLNQLNSEGLVSFEMSKTVPSLKQYMDSTSVPTTSIWNDISRALDNTENTGYTSQQAIALLERVIQIGSDEGNIVLDPFCGSGTTLVTAQKLKRRWIGCDISQQAYDIALQRVGEATQGTLEVEFQEGTESSVIVTYPTRTKLEDPKPEVKLWNTDTTPTSPKQQDTVKPLIMTEGKTDWKHLKSAFLRFKEAGYFNEDFNIDFHEYNNDDMGDNELYKLCLAYSKLPQPRKHIFIFDRDNHDMIKKVTDASSIFKNWGNNVYSFSIPIPSHRIETPKVSIELYYHNDDIKRTDKHGRRLFLSNEFNPLSGRHKDDNLNCHDINRLKGDLNIIDNRVFDNVHQNVAMTKDTFASNILNKEENFSDLDISEFKSIFELVEEIMNHGDAEPT